jgi:glyoxylase-like metal-dependent hydrolase (beta-lactamase superfamily II)
MTPQTACEPLSFDRSFEGMPGELVRVSPLVRRMVAGNAGPMTFTGTCTYVVGTGHVAVVDPGPEATAHIAALVEALRGEIITAILVTHTHKDHSPGARLLKEATGAGIHGCPPCTTTAGDTGDTSLRLDAAHDLLHAPDIVMQDGDTIEGPSFTLACVATPGHTSNHRCFALPQEAALFTGDHVMAWSTTVVAPPDGNMSAYMESLDKLLHRDDAIYWPGHGGPVRDPHRAVAALARHRRDREAAILACLSTGLSQIDAIVTHVYRDLDPALRNAAACSVLAHLESLVEQGLVVIDGESTRYATYRRA